MRIAIALAGGESPRDVAERYPSRNGKPMAYVVLRAEERAGRSLVAAAIRAIDRGSDEPCAWELIVAAYNPSRETQEIDDSRQAARAEDKRIIAKPLMRRRRLSLTDGFIKSYIGSLYGLPARFMTPALIEARRAIIKIRRLVREKKP